MEELRQRSANLDKLLYLIQKSDADPILQLVKDDASFRELHDALARVSPKPDLQNTNKASRKPCSEAQDACPATVNGKASSRDEKTSTSSESDDDEMRTAPDHIDDDPMGKLGSSFASTDNDQVPLDIQDGARLTDNLNDTTLFHPASTSSPYHSHPVNEVWRSLTRRCSATELRKINMPVFSCDPYHIETDDMLSKILLSFRDGARHAIREVTNIYSVVGSKEPNLELLFRPRREADPYTAWTWACEMTKAYPLPFQVQLTGVFIAGIQMRVKDTPPNKKNRSNNADRPQYFIHPCHETYEDLPIALRPTQQQYILPHAAGVDLCAM